MKSTGLALCLLTNLVACSGGGSSTRNGGGATAGQASAGSSDPGTSGSAGGAQAGASGGATEGGTTVASAGGSAGTVVAGRSAALGGSSAAGAGSTGSSCGVTVVHASRATPDVLLVLDRSASMESEILTDRPCRSRTDAGNCQSRWDTLSSALNTVLSDTPSIRWGLKLFATPNSSSCSVSNQIEVAIGSDSGPTILRLMEQTSLMGNTPTRAAIMAAASYLKTIDGQNGRFILLATDGLPNCPGNGTPVDPDLPATLEAIKSAGFPVYVVGIGPEEVLVDLETIAMAGGTGHFFPATSPEQLTAALLSISDSVATCTFKLSAAPPNPDNVTVMLDQKAIPLDSANGWGYAGDKGTIELHGDSCKAIKSSTTTTLTVEFRC